MSNKSISYYNKCPDCGCDRTLVVYDYVDIRNKTVGKGVKCESCMTRWRSFQILTNAQRAVNQTKPNLALVV